MSEDQEVPYASAAILFVLNRDTEPEGEGLTEKQIKERILQLSEEELEQVDQLWLNLCEDVRTGRLKKK
jgi:hypothetical protein